MTTFEMITRDDALSGIDWQCMVVDEAHRLKNSAGKLGVRLREYRRDHVVLLTGTPLQNNTEELWALLNFLSPERFGDKRAFVEQFKDMADAKQVNELNEMMKPFLLRRLKQDVDTKLPPKEETIVEVELTSVQKKYYRAIYERNTEFLMKGVKSKHNAPNLMNVVVELRKVCNHPYLVKGVEEAVTENQSDPAKLASLFVSASGKFVLLDKLLPKLQSGGHRVLIFSQMVRVLNLLAEFLKYRHYGFERLDGSIRGHERQVRVRAWLV